MRNLPTASSLFFALATMLLCSMACQQPSEESPSPDDEPEITADIEAGEELYEQICALCHGPGAPPEADLTGVTERMDFDEFDRLMSEGGVEMPAFNSIKDQQRRNLWEYMGSEKFQ